MSERGNTEESWRLEIPALADRLRDLGYDIEPPQPGVSPIGSIVARRDLEDRAVVLAIDAGGRFRAAMTWVVGEWPSRDEIAGVPVRVVDAVSRAVTVTGLVERPEQVLAVIAGLKTVAPWVGAMDSEQPRPGDGQAQDQ